MDTQTELNKIKELKKRILFTTAVGLIIVPLVLFLVFYFFMDNFGFDDWGGVIYGGLAVFVLGFLFLPFSAITAAMIFKTEKLTLIQKICVSLLFSVACVGIILTVKIFIF